MLRFFDNQNLEHVFNLENFVHLQVRTSDEKNVTLTIHMLGPHLIPVTVSKATAKQVLIELGNQYAIEH